MEAWWRAKPADPCCSPKSCFSRQTHLALHNFLGACYRFDPNSFPRYCHLFALGYQLGCFAIFLSGQLCFRIPSITFRQRRGGRQPQHIREQNQCRITLSFILCAEAQFSVWQPRAAVSPWKHRVQSSPLCCASIISRCNVFSSPKLLYFFKKNSIPKPPWLHNSQNQQHTLHLRTLVQDGPGRGCIAAAHISRAELQARSSRVPLLIFLCSSWLDSFSAFFHWAFPLLNSKDILYFRLEHGVHDKAGEHMGSTNIWMVRAQTDFSDHLLLYPQLGMLWVFSKDGAVSSDTRALVTPLHHICLAVPSKAMTLTQEPPVAIGFSVSIKPTKQAGILH